MQGMFSVMTDPVFQIDGKKSISVRKDGSPTDASDEAKKEAEMLIKKFQKTMAASSTSDLFELYCAASSLNGNSEWVQQVTSNAALQKFASKLLKIIWLMISQDPPICLKWLEPETKVDKNSFTFYRISGETVRRTIWPAVYLHATGPLMAKGVVQPK
ncbi:hypothetical protein ACJMK2_031210 [Sinanodonta woodiana]|uniref:Mitochondria-eating protein C-terminal domain-containing protein n=1 Tax=Sinanodonta woodiana TaxID=1069815 RepID=A0ABD3WXY6_SINWO